MRAVQFNLFGLLLASSTAHAQFQLNMTPGITPISHDIFNLHMTVLWVCTAIGILVFGTMLYAIIKHRKSKGAKAAHFHEHLYVELAWTIIPFLILVGIAIPGTRVLVHINDTSEPALTVKITGYQWKWRYEYLDQGVSFFSNLSTPIAQLNGKEKKGVHYLAEVDHPLVVPINKKIRFVITSNDVIHSWWVPALGVKRDAVPGFINESWATLNRPGTYRGQCAELCGVNHAFMPIVVIAMSEKGFENWVAQQKGGVVPAPAPAPAPSAVPPMVKPVPATAAVPVTATAAPAVSAPVSAISKDDAMKKGEGIYMSTCAVCHQQGGEGMPPVYPALKGSPIAVGPAPAHIDIVLNGKPGTAMQAFKDQFSDEDLAAVITYERNAWGNNKGDVIQPQDIKSARK